MSDGKTLREEGIYENVVKEQYTETLSEPHMIFGDVQLMINDDQ
jgi:hypothetical protein